MIIIGDTNIFSESVHTIQTFDEIESTPSNSTIIFKFDVQLMRYCAQNQVPYAVIINSIREAIYANALHAKYVISNFEMAKQIQPLADDYLFDTKILTQISSEEMIEKAALARIDGVIYKHLVQL
jgi:hypothetical protein